MWVYKVSNYPSKSKRFFLDSPPCRLVNPPDKIKPADGFSRIDADWLSSVMA